jgi:hypothetical protein
MKLYEVRSKLFSFDMQIKVSFIFNLKQNSNFACIESNPKEYLELEREIEKV